VVTVKLAEDIIANGGGVCWEVRWDAEALWGLEWMMKLEAVRQATRQAGDRRDKRHRRPVTERARALGLETMAPRDSYAKTTSFNAMIEFTIHM
jgi:hypothetical protein